MRRRDEDIAIRKPPKLLVCMCVCVVTYDYGNLGVAYLRYGLGTCNIHGYLMARCAKTPQTGNRRQVALLLEIARQWSTFNQVPSPPI
jgi:hypothetical protein